MADDKSSLTERRPSSPRNPYDGAASAVEIPVMAPTLTVLNLAAITFYSVSGGPFYTDQCVRSGGAFYALLAYIVTPFVISFQESQMTAELSLAFPHSSGSVVWCEAAFGPFVGWLNGTLSLVYGITDNAIYPAIFLNYVLTLLPTEANSEEQLQEYQQFLLVASFALLMSLLNWMGLDWIGHTTNLVGILSMSPIILFVLIGMWQVDPSKWLEKPTLSPQEFQAVSQYELDGGLFPNATLGGILLRPFVNTLFITHNAFDSTGTFSEDCGEHPEKIIPRALHIALAYVMASYLVPMAVATGVSDGTQADWTNGYLAELGTDIAGPWLGHWIVFGAGISSIALYQSAMSTAVFKLMGMAHNGLLPRWFGIRSKHGTPTNAIISSTAVIVVLSMVHLHKLVEMQNFVFGIALLLEYAAFIKLRTTQPDVARPYRVPFGTTGCILMFIPTVIAIFAVLLLASYHSMLFGTITVIVAIVTYIVFAKRIFKHRDDIRRERSSVNLKGLDDETEIL